MKPLFLLSLAALAVAGCSESTSPTSNLAPDYAKPGSDPVISVAGTLTNDSFSFDDGTFSSAAGSSFFIEDLDGGFGASAPSFAGVYNNASNRFIGRLDNHKVGVAVTNAGSKYAISFDLYIIGSWDGDGQQSGKQWGADVWSAGIACSPSGLAVANLMTTTFSNQKTVQQSYPDQYNDGRGGGPAFRGAFAVDALGFINDPTSHTPQDMSAGDSWYKLSFTGNNPCGGGNPLYLVFTVPNANLQSNYDESWGVDNVSIKTDP
jgi:hypothetical protein